MREDLLNGKLEYPGFMTLLKYIRKEDDILAFWNAIWISFLNNSEVNGINWYNVLGGECFNYIIRALANHDWIISDSLTGRKWVAVRLNPDKLLEWVTVDELQEIKAAYQRNKYAMESRYSSKTDIVRQNGVARVTGLVRKGFCAAGNSKFKFDMRKLKQYRKPVELNLCKSMDKIREKYPKMRTDSAMYDSVAIDLFEEHCNNPNQVFTTGNNISDSRGRAISDCLKKLNNPISNKDFRASLIITYPEE